MNVPTLSIRIHADIRVTVPHNLTRMTPFILVEQEDWFEDEIHFVRRLLLPGEQAVDIGANYGLYTLSMAHQVGPNGQVWAFEPASDTASYLKKSVANNGFHHVTVIQQALSDHTGSAQLNLCNNPECNSLHTSALLPDDNTETVPLTTLDTAANEFGIDHVSFLKLDAEGEEVPILAGAHTTLASPGPLVMFELKHNNQVNLPLIQRFAELEYDIYQLVPGLGFLVPVDSVTNQTYQLNLFAATPARAAMLAKRGLLLLPTEPLERPLEDAPKNRWQTHLKTLPFATQLLAAWEKPGPAGAMLDDYLAAHDAAQPLADRYAMLCRAVTRAEALAEHNLWHTMTLVRLKAALNGGGFPHAEMQQMYTLAASGKLPPTDAPFLPPHPRYDQIDPGDRLPQWAAAATMETCERGLSHSTYFTHQQTLPQLEAFHRLGFPSPQMARRRQLVRVLTGKQAGFEAEPQLIQHGPENLNPEFWSSPPS